MMKISTLLSFFSGVAYAVAQLPVQGKLRGVNLGGWLVAEPWMYPEEWSTMGGDNNCACGDPDRCAASEWALTRKLGQKAADAAFLRHWQRWTTAADIARAKLLGLQFFRIPVGFWIIEEIVDRKTEFYPRGGYLELRRLLKQTKDAGLWAQIELHALPGVSSPNQAFAGNCTASVHFYRDDNYVRALTHLAVFTAVSHLDDGFGAVFSIQAMNEPIQDASQTPGLQQFYSDFVTVLRSVESTLNIACSTSLGPALLRLGKSKNARLAIASAVPLIPVYLAKGGVQITADTSKALKRLLGLCGALPTVSQVAGVLTTSPVQASVTVLPTLIGAGSSGPLGPLPLPAVHVSAIPSVLNHTQAVNNRRSVPLGRQCLTASAMVSNWQYKGTSASLAPVALGPSVYDDHVYYSFGGVAPNNTFAAYLETICNDNRLESAKAKGEVPRLVEEWSLATNWASESHAQLRDWGDAQRWKYEQSSGWCFWTLKSEWPNWSYFDAVDKGYLPQRADELFTPNICKPYIHRAA